MSGERGDIIVIRVRKHAYTLSPKEVQAEIDNTEYTVIPIEKLVPWEANPRRNVEQAAERLTRTVSEVGWGPDILVQKSTMRIIGGHVRRLCAIKLGLKRVPCKLLDVDDERAEKMALADNQASTFAEWDDDGLANILAKYDEDIVEALGWEMDEAGVKEMDERERPTTPVSSLESEFWIMVKGPLELQPDALEELREKLEGMNLVVDIGIVEL
jgi:hypothetical protein